MSGDEAPGGAPLTARAGASGLRRRLVHLLIAPFDGGAPSHARLQPGAEAFPKQDFELGRDEPQVPGGQSLGYIRLVRRLWLDVWTREADAPASPRKTWLRRLHAAVLRAHELERELLDRIEARP